MKYFTLIICFILSSCAVFKSAPNSMCEYLKLENCGSSSKKGLSRSAGAGAPTANSAAFSNPSAIALSRGFGIETITFDGSQIGIITGTGRIGAAISNNPSDGTFFGNTPIEPSDEYRLRRVESLKYQEDKLVLAGGVNIFGSDKGSWLQMDIGGMYRRHGELAKDYYGAGVSFSIKKSLALVSPTTMIFFIVT